MKKLLKHEIEGQQDTLHGFLNRISWLLAKFASQTNLKEKITQKQAIIHIPEQYAQLSSGNTFDGLQLFHEETKGKTTVKNGEKGRKKSAEYTLRVWIYLTAQGTIGYIESIEIQGQSSCLWQHNVWSLNEEQKFQSAREESHSIPGMTHTILKGIVLERLGVSFESRANGVIKQFLRS